MTSRTELNQKWESRWLDGTATWHMTTFHLFMKKHFQTWTNDVTEGKRVIVPLCGATQDMFWFYRQGLSVVGVELSEVGINKFFTDHNLEYNIEVINGVNVYKHDDRLQLFQCDIFSTTVDLLGGMFDYWFDRGGLVAMVEDEQEKYINHLISLMSPNGRVFMECFEYEPSLREGPPRPIFLTRLTELFADRYDIMAVDRVTEAEKPPEHDNTKFPSDFLYVYYIFTAKSM